VLARGGARSRGNGRELIKLGEKNREGYGHSLGERGNYPLEKGEWGGARGAFSYPDKRRPYPFLRNQSALDLPPHNFEGITLEGAGLEKKT